jgi:hypothetical protein
MVADIVIFIVSAILMGLHSTEYSNRVFDAITMPRVYKNFYVWWEDFVTVIPLGFSIFGLYVAMSWLYRL